ncbi:hypothetical protein BC827DRAFT_736831 [Russula dissimulans]|nr:hypothetical protein BC827DRAFT_736831 [Russula dissimulans]
MLCIPLTKSNFTLLRAISNAARKILPLNNRPSSIWPIVSQPYHSSSSSHHSLLPTPCMTGSPALPQPSSRPHSPAVVSPSASSTTSAPFVADHLTSAEISRASAAAIRVSVARGDIWDGFHLWHSLHWSMHHYHTPGPDSPLRPLFRNPITAFVPVDFGRPVSTRFAGHCLLHGLLRAGETKAAAMLTEQMIAYGEELHPLSFNILLRQLHPSARPDSPRTVDGHLTPHRKMTRRPGVLELQNVMPMDPFTRFAVRLLNSAREHRWQRTAGMYESVLRACLIQGEILVASLLLALLLKDYQLRQACSRVAAEAERMGVQDTMAYVHSKIPEAPSRGFRILPSRGSRFLYQSVTEFLETHCARVDDPLFPEASQALANLASALDNCRIPYMNMATLIKILYSYPQCVHIVWITLPSGERQSCNAYRYFHGVLFNLLCSLPDRRSVDSNTSQLPRMNLESYNALLNYALRHRHSLMLADRVLHHMTELRKPPLAPNIATYNILLRGSTLMRRNDIAESVLRIMRGRMSDNQPGASVLNFSSGWQPRVQSCPTNFPSGSNHRHFRRLIEDNRKYDLSIPKPKEPLEPDNMSLTSYMAYLVATGRPNAVATVITQVIPEFEPPETPTTPEELLTRWETSVDRGVGLGPHFFAVALNALHKAGLRKLAERVWALASAAESKSLQSDRIAPWCLSVHAYTAMLQLYADETRGWYVDHLAAGGERSTQPRRPRDPRRAMSGLRKGMQVFRALSLASDKVREAALRACEEGRKWKHVPAPPSADARFYNAALSLVCRRPGMRRRVSRARSRRRWNRMLGEARQRFMQTGQKPRGWTPELEEIAKSVRSSGHALPIGFQLRLVGREDQVISQNETDATARPYSFPRKIRTRFAPHRIPT